MHGAKFEDASQTDVFRLTVSSSGGRSIIRNALRFIATVWAMYNMGHWITGVDAACQGVIWRVAASKKYEAFTMNYSSFHISSHIILTQRYISILNVSRPMGFINIKYLS